MRLNASLFKEEIIEGKYRAHFRVTENGQEICRFGLEYKKKPKDTTLERASKRKLKQISEILPKLKATIEVTVDV